MITPSCDSPPAPLALRLAITAACNLHCIYCSPESAPSSSPRYDRISLHELLWFVRSAQRFAPVQKVHLTGGEPLLRKGLPAFVHALAATGVPDIALTTNGQRLATLAATLAHAGLRRINVSLDTLRPHVYSRITRGAQLQPVLDGIAAARAAGLSVKLNMVVLRGWNDDELPSLARFALDHGCHIRFLELMPIGCARPLFLSAYLPAALIAAALSAHFSLTPLPSTPACHQRFLLSNGCRAQCTAGIIASVSQPFCTGCRRLRLTAGGALLGCLARPHALDLLPHLRARNVDGLHLALCAALQHKRHDSSFDQPVSMVSIGG